MRTKKKYVLEELTATDHYFQNNQFRRRQLIKQKTKEINRNKGSRGGRWTENNQSSSWRHFFLLPFLRVEEFKFKAPLWRQSLPRVWRRAREKTRPRSDWVARIGEGNKHTNKYKHQRDCVLHWKWDFRVVHWTFAGELVLRFSALGTRATGKQSTCLGPPKYGGYYV